MHMARLWDTSLDKVGGTGSGYSLEAVTSYLSLDKRFEKIKMKVIFYFIFLKKIFTLVINYRIYLVFQNY